MASFFDTSEHLAAIEVMLSTDRLSAYRAATRGELREAVHLYEQKLRNRVAHHEPILFSGRLEKYLREIFDTIAWMSPVAARWVRSNSSFAERFAAYRERFPEIASRR